jgi:UDP-perosamine 4-acetyltransferase
LKIGVIGAGGHARVISEILHYADSNEIVAYIDQPRNKVFEDIDGVPVLGSFLGDPSIIMKLISQGMEGFIVAVGDNPTRRVHFIQCVEAGLKPINAIHPTAHIAHNVTLGKGITVAAGTIICSEAVIGNNSIINSGSIVEHECIIEDHVHVAPGTIIAGRVFVGQGSFIGAGSVVKEKIRIGKNVTIGAGSVVLQNIPDNQVAVGSPARMIK